MIEDSTRGRLATVVVVGRGLTGDPGTPDVLAGLAREVHAANDAKTGLSLAERVQPQLAIIRESIPEADAIALLRGMKSLCPRMLSVVVADPPCAQDAVKFVKAGASDYLQGPLDSECLGGLMLRLKADLAHAGRAGRRFFDENCPGGVDMVGTSLSAARTLETIRLVAQSRCNPVLILGPTGTGKELAARAVHAWRCGPGEPFVAVNCAALTASLLESELFGHVKGAFTGAHSDKTGLFAAAGAGTLFLDEISEMPLELQAKLLRVLQDRTFRKVGSTKDIVCNATVIASSNRDLLGVVRSAGAAPVKGFRKDLYYRLAVFPIVLDSLACRDRREDIELLAEFFVRNCRIVDSTKVRGLTRAALDKLASHDWPGNVRELRNVIDRALILERSGRIDVSSIVLDPPGSARAAVATAGGGEAPARRDAKDFSLETAEREFILRALKETGWQRTRAATLLGITRATLHAKLKRYDIQAPSQRSTTTVVSRA